MKTSVLLAWVFLIIPLLSFGKLNKIVSHPNWELLNYDRCGISNSDRIVGGSNAPMGAYPWLARIGYIRRRFPQMSPIHVCGGAVINKLYVITAAHCTADLPKNLKPVNVRLGEYNTKTNPDCENSICNDAYQEYDIDEIITHEKWYDPKMKNDIALIRLKKEINFTDFVRPICMMKGKLLEKDLAKQIVEVAGWGVFNIDRPRASQILQMVKLPVHLITYCTLDKDYKKFSIDSSQMCVGGKVGEDSCSGDSGGPLMYVDSSAASGPPRYYVIGIVSFGPDACGASNRAGIYTNLSKYILWILDHLRA